MKNNFLVLLILIIFTQSQTAHAGLFSTFFANVASDALDKAYTHADDPLFKQKKVQAALGMMGYFDGRLDGDLNSLDSRLAIKGLQIESGRKNSGMLSEVDIEQLLYLSNLYVSLKKGRHTGEKLLVVYREIDTTIDALKDKKAKQKSKGGHRLRVIVESTEVEGANVFVGNDKVGNIDMGHFTTYLNKGDYQISIRKITEDGEWGFSGQQMVKITSASQRPFVIVAMSKKPTQARLDRLAWEKAEIKRHSKGERLWWWGKSIPLDVPLAERYSKIAADGTVLDIDAPQWSCVLDAHTQLVWEVKTSDDGLHDKDKTYRWGGKGKSPISIGHMIDGNRREKIWDGSGPLYDDWNTLVDGSNHKQLCGYKGWRLPNLYELASLVSCGNGTWEDIDEGCEGDYTKPTGHIELFPHLVDKLFWSSSPRMGGAGTGTEDYAWSFGFEYGNDATISREALKRVRLVHEASQHNTDAGIILEKKRLSKLDREAALDLELAERYSKISKDGTGTVIDRKTGQRTKWFVQDIPFAQRYRKIGADGTVLDIDALKWSCVLDTHTQLVWEVKTNDDDLHNKNKTYRWGGRGTSSTGFNYRDDNPHVAWDGSGWRFNDWDALVDGSNREKLCGYSEWRVPNVFELTSLVDCGEGDWSLWKGCLGNFSKPTGHIELFPHIIRTSYWASTPSGYKYAYISNFSYGNISAAGYDAYRKSHKPVRLVHDASLNETDADINEEKHLSGVVKAGAEEKKVDEEVREDKD